jgi:hypothetical protein
MSVAQVVATAVLAIDFALFTSIAALTVWDLAIGEPDYRNETRVQALVAGGLAAATGALLCLIIL